MFSRHGRRDLGPDRILIDDKDSNVESFRAAGGDAILIPRHWNSTHADSDKVLKVLRNGLLQMAGI